MENNTTPCPLCSGNDVVLFFCEDKNYRQVYYHCLDCDLVFVAPECRLSSSDEKARYDMHNNDESQHYVDFLSRLATPTLQYLPPHSRGLDFGSGTSQAMAKLFRQQGHDCQCYDIFYYPTPTLLEQKYDFLIASEVIEHLYEPKVVFEQWLSLLHANGVLAIMTCFRPVERSFSAWWYKNDPTHVSLFSAKTFKFLEQRYGLKRLLVCKDIAIFRLPQ